ncbi:MAG: hypothetical protein ACYDDU_06930 [Dermatophilaceae bacterium]
MIKPAANPLAGSCDDPAIPSTTPSGAQIGAEALKAAAHSGQTVDGTHVRYVIARASGMKPGGCSAITNSALIDGYLITASHQYADESSWSNRANARKLTE